MIDGLKLTMTGEELRKRLDDRVKQHERLVAWYKREAKREPIRRMPRTTSCRAHVRIRRGSRLGAQALAHPRNIEGGKCIASAKPTSRWRDPAEKPDGRTG